MGIFILIIYTELQRREEKPIDLYARIKETGEDLHEIELPEVKTPKEVIDKLKEVKPNAGILFVNEKLEHLSQKIQAVKEHKHVVRKIRERVQAGEDLKKSHENVKQALEGLKEFEAEHKATAIIQAKNKLHMISASLEDIHKEREKKIVVNKEKINQVKAKLRKISKDLEETQQEHAQLKRKKAQKPLEGKKPQEPSPEPSEEENLAKVAKKLRKLTKEAEEISRKKS